MCQWLVFFWVILSQSLWLRMTLIKCRVHAWRILETLSLRCDISQTTKTWAIPTLDSVLQLFASLCLSTLEDSDLWTEQSLNLKKMIALGACTVQVVVPNQDDFTWSQGGPEARHCSRWLQECPKGCPYLKGLWDGFKCFYKRFEWRAVGCTEALPPPSANLFSALGYPMLWKGGLVSSPRRKPPDIIAVKNKLWVFLTWACSIKFTLLLLLLRMAQHPVSMKTLVLYRQLCA